MLKGIPPCISPDLIKIMMEMGHDDELILADANFPAASNATRLIRYDGIKIPELLEAILLFFPLDDYKPKPVTLMSVTRGQNVKPVIWNQYRDIIKKHDKNFTAFDYMDRTDFYERARKAYAIVATSETAYFANIILKKGVIRDKTS